MKMKRLVSAVAALAMSVSAFAGLTAYADETLDPIACTQSAGFTDNGNTFVLNTADVETPALVYWNNTSGTWKGVAVLEFALPEIEADRVKSATISYSVHNGSSRSGGRTYSAYAADVVIDSATTADTLQAISLSSAIYSGAAVAQNETRIDSMDVTDYLTEKVTADATKLQVAFSNSSQALDIDPATASLQVILFDAGAVSADYTINYTLGDTVVKSVQDSNIVGTEIVAETPFTENGVKYYAADGATTAMTLVDGTNVLNVAVREANTYNVNVNATGDITKALSTVSVTEGEDVTYYFPRYIADGTALYSTPAQNKGYYATATAVAADADIAVPYTAVADTEVAFFAEAEDIEGATARTSGNANIRCSLGTGASFAEDTTVTTLPAGKYIITAGVWGNSGVTFTITAGENVLTADTVGWHTEVTGEEITLTEDTVVVISAAGDSSKMLDYILIKKTGDVEVTPELTLPEVTVATGTDYTENTGNPARTYTGTFTVGENNVAVSGVLWTVGEKTATSTFDTVISSGTVVTGLVVVAADLEAIPAPVATAVAAE